MRWRAALMAWVLCVGCGDRSPAASDDARSADGERIYSAAALSDGVEFDIDDPDGAVESATVLLADAIEGAARFSPQLEADGVAVMPGDGTPFDVIALYRTGPYCGLVPDVRLEMTPSPVLRVNSKSGDCDSMEYDEAIGLVLATPIDPAVLTIEHSIDPFVDTDAG